MYHSRELKHLILNGKSGCRYVNFIISRGFRFGKDENLTKAQNLLFSKVRSNHEKLEYKLGENRLNIYRSISKSSVSCTPEKGFNQSEERFKNFLFGGGIALFAVLIICLHYIKNMSNDIVYVNSYEDKKKTSIKT